MKCVPTIETKNRNLDQLGKDAQKRMDGLDFRVSNMEKIVKKLADQYCIILKTTTDKFNTLLNKMERSKGQDSPAVNEDQGSSKHTRANSKKTEGVEEKMLDDMKSFLENMNILADQVVDLLMTL